MNNTINTLTKTHTLINDFLPVKQMQTNEVKLKIFFCLFKKKKKNKWTTNLITISKMKTFFFRCYNLVAILAFDVAFVSKLNKKKEKKKKTKQKSIEHKYLEGKLYHTLLGVCTVASITFWPGQGPIA